MPLTNTVGPFSKVSKQSWTYDRAYPILISANGNEVNWRRLWDWSLC